MFTYTFGLQNTLPIKGRKYTSIKVHALCIVMGKILLALGTITTFSFYLWLLPSEVLFRVFPFKVLFHVQNSMHAIAKYCSSVEKRTNIWLNSCYICCLSALFYFSLCDCSQVAISPPAISPPVSMVKPIVDSIHVYEHIFEDALSLSCDFPPLLMAFNFSWQPQQMEGPFIMLFFLFHRASSEPCVCVWLSMWAAF